MPYVSTRDKQNLYLKDWGAGRPVILIHGWPLSADSWDDVAVPLAQAGFRTIAYDRRGFGRSDQPWDGYDYNTFADDLAAVIEATGARDAALVGFSMGGGEVARYMSRHSGRNVAQAALIGSVVPYLLKGDTNPNGVPQAVFDDMLAGIQKDRAHFFANFFKVFFGAGAISSPVSSEVVEWARDTALRASLRATLECVVAFAGTDFRPDLASFKVPTLIIHGTDDQIVPIDVSSRLAAQGIAGAKLIEYSGGPHGLFASHKDRLTKDLLAFLKG
jgi:pimeloyl-ACP methyl ester carboxylesterase